MTYKIVWKDSNLDCFQDDKFCIFFQMLKEPTATIAPIAAIV
jgi:hypothetical protein